MGEAKDTNRQDCAFVKVNAVVHSLIDDKKRVIATGIFGTDEFRHGLKQVKDVYESLEKKELPDTNRTVKVVYVDNVRKFKPQLDLLWETDGLGSSNVPCPGTFMLCSAQF